MKMPYQEYEMQIKKAYETISLLEEKLNHVQLKLQKSPDDAIFRRELKQITLDMTITLNELEHAQSVLENCLRK